MHGLSIYQHGEGAKGVVSATLTAAAAAWPCARQVGDDMLQALSFEGWVGVLAFLCCCLDIVDYGCWQGTAGCVCFSRCCLIQPPC